MKTVRSPNKKVPKSTPTGRTVDTGPTSGKQFPDTDHYKGRPVDSEYATVPTDKSKIQANLKKAGEENQTRFGLEERGVKVPRYQK
jgi:hypothetical protein